MTEERYIPTLASRERVRLQLRAATELSAKANDQLDELIALLEQQINRDNIARRRTIGKTGSQS